MSVVCQTQYFKTCTYFTKAGKRHDCSGNEDALYVGERVVTDNMNRPRTIDILEGTVLVVADGLGFHSCSRKASQYVAGQLGIRLRLISHEEDISLILAEVNRELVVMAQEAGDQRARGCVAAGVVLRGEKVMWFSLGDCSILRMTRLEAHFINHGQRAPGRNDRVTQCFGGTLVCEELTPEVGSYTPSDGESLLIVSDGVTDILSLEEVAASGKSHATKRVSYMAQLWKLRGRGDDVAIVYLRPRSS